MLLLFNVVRLALHMHVPLLCLHYIQWGRTPLDRARQNGHNAVVILLEKGTDFSEFMTFKDRM